MRVYGDGISIDASFDNTRSESIVNRLLKLLVFLDREESQQNWAGYLDNGALNWSRIALVGQSQGAGMAAYIAKGQLVARVILFSSPWDFFVSNGKLQMMAPWLATPSWTPPERWFGGYHARENQANLLTKSYATLRIPPQNIRVFKGNLPPYPGGNKGRESVSRGGSSSGLRVGSRIFSGPLAISARITLPAVTAKT